MELTGANSGSTLNTTYQSSSSNYMSTTVTWYLFDLELSNDVLKSHSIDNNMIYGFFFKF